MLQWTGGVAETTWGGVVLLMLQLRRHVGVTGNTTVGGTLQVSQEQLHYQVLMPTVGADIADTLTLSKADGTGLSVTSNATVQEERGRYWKCYRGKARCHVTSNATGGIKGVTGNTTLGGVQGVTGATTLSGARCQQRRRHC